MTMSHRTISALETKIGRQHLENPDKIILKVNMDSSKRVFLAPV